MKSTMQMRHAIALAAALLLAPGAARGQAQAPQYESLDKSNPIAFLGDRILFKGEEIVLGERALFLDGGLPDVEADAHPYAFNTLAKAVERLVPGSEAEPMTVYVAPWVYWVDDPDDPEVRRGDGGREPIGLAVDCPCLSLVGLTDDASNVVMAANRGQTQGAVGNFTMLEFTGDGLRLENLTLGNFCNVDLEFPLKPELGRKRRMPAITQAQVAYCHGDRIMARNVGFIGRLNMCPMVGTRRALYQDCHMECTDDALNGSGVYIGCTFGLYGQKPLWSTSPGGAVFLDCDFFARGDYDSVYFCKSAGPVAVVDCRFHAGRPIHVGWTQDPPEGLRCYQANFTLDSEPCVIGAERPENTVIMDGEKHLGAFRLEDGDSVVYNTYNLLRGNDGWDPLGIREDIERISLRDGTDYTRMATSLDVVPGRASIRTGEGDVEILARAMLPSGIEAGGARIEWTALQGPEPCVEISGSGNACRVESLNHGDGARRAIVTATTEDGLEGAAELEALPDLVEAPRFTRSPAITVSGGVARVDYALDLGGREDRSAVTWYRSAGKDGGDMVPVAVSRGDSPRRTYRLTRRDAGHRICASVTPMHARSLPGETAWATTGKAIKRSQTSQGKSLETDFGDFPTEGQPRILPGFWTVDGCKPADTAGFDWDISPGEPFWTYGEGTNGARGKGLFQVQRGARIMYCPLGDERGDMEATLEVAPAKTAGQGFNSATGQYLDLYVGFDPGTLTGYALRIVRTTKYSDAVDFLLVRYDGGRVTPISAPVSSTCFRTPCRIELRASKGKLVAHAETTAAVPPRDDPALLPSVDLEAEIQPSEHGGTGILYTGSCGEGIVSLRGLEARWEQ